MDPTKKELYTAKRNTGLDVSDTDVIDAWNGVRDTDFNWLIVVVELSGNARMTLHRTGSGGFDEMKNVLNDDNIYYCIFKLKVFGISKFIHMYFIGDNVNGIKRGKGSLYKTSIFNCFEGHGEICVNGLNDLSRVFVISEISKIFKVDLENVDL